MPFESPRGRQQVSETRSVPAPIGGLNYRDSAAAMPPTDALRMLNFQPLPYAVAVRKGWKKWGGPYPSALYTCINHIIDRSATGQHVLLATSTDFYVQMGGGETATLPTKTGAGGSWIGTSIRNEAGIVYTYLVQAGSYPMIYHGTSGSSPTSNFETVGQSMSETSIGPWDVFGVNPSRFGNVCLHKNRLWFVEVSSCNAWYLPDGAISGVAKKYPLGGVFSKGGTLRAIATWTVDAGSGMDDYIVFISSEGQVAIYGGEVVDTDWGLQGVYDIGAPIGLKCWCKYGGDLVLITTDGLMPLSKALQSTRVNSSVALTDKIQHLISALISDYKDFAGWQVLVFPNENQLWLITPPILTPVDSGNVERVRVFSMNTITGAWCEYANMDIRDVALYSDVPLFCTFDGYVGLAWQGNLDAADWFIPGLGEYIDAEVLSAYNYFNEQSRNKRWVMARPIFQSGTVPASNILISTDFELLDTPGLPSSVVVPASLAYWGVALWDIDRWPEEVARYRRWITVNGIGYCAALNLRVRSGGPLLWTATDFVYEMGGVI